MKLREIFSNVDDEEFKLLKKFMRENHFKRKDIWSVYYDVDVDGREYCNTLTYKNSKEVYDSIQEGYVHKRLRLLVRLNNFSMILEVKEEDYK